MRTGQRLDRRTARRIGRRIVRWYATNGRNLPWRENPNPYRVWISEIMLQQTTVAAVVPYYLRFLDRFPDVASLSSADEQDVLSCWSGLGYYNRARNLKRAAKQIVERHGGRVPDEYEPLRDLSGIGEYTAGAILSIGYNKPHVALDGNIMRVVARIGGIEGDPSRVATRRSVAGQVRMMMPGKEASAFNQALMDIGSMLCMPRGPLCGACPAAVGCVAHQEELTEVIPEAPPPTGSVDIEMAAMAVLKGTECLLVRREGKLMTGFWDYPLVPNEADNAGVEKLARSVGARVSGVVGRFRHTITRHRMGITVYRATRATGRKRARPRGWVLSEPGAHLASMSEGKVETAWVSLDEAAGESLPLPLTAIGRKVARLLKRETP